MKYTRTFIIALILSSSLAVFCQEKSQKENNGNNPFLRQKPTKTVVPQDTIKLFLDDSLHYISSDDERYTKMIKLYTSLIDNWYYPTYILSENLADGFYCLYNLTRKQASTRKDLHEYLVISGEIKNGKRQGAFHLHYIPENDKRKSAEIILNFKDDLLHGPVIELENDRFLLLGEYNMGIRDGLFYYYNRGTPVVMLYENGKLIKDAFYR